MIDFGKLQKTLKHLQRQHENYVNSNNRPELNALVHEALSESVIQRFEICYDSTWKLLKRYLVESLGVADVPNSPKPILRLAAENYLLASSVEQWFKYATARTETSHHYSSEKASLCLDIVPEFIEDAVQLYEKLTEQTWE